MLHKVKCEKYNPQRRFIGRLPKGQDLIKSLEAFCQEQNISIGVFSLIGAVSSAKIGAYDQKRQIYESFQKDREFEILHCTGNISLKDSRPFVHAHIMLADAKGQTLGGHLFSDTIIYAAEIDLQELGGPALERSKDSATGLMLWNFT